MLERGIVDGKLDMVTAEALQKLIAAACRVYTARVEAGEPIMPVPKKFDFRNRRDGHGERIVKSRRSRGFRARHVAKLDGPLRLVVLAELEQSGETPWISSLIAVAA